MGVLHQENVVRDSLTSRVESVDKIKASKAMLALFVNQGSGRDRLNDVLGVVVSV